MSSPTHRRGSAVATALLLGLEACSAPRKQALAPPTVSLHEAAVTGNSVAIGQHVAAGSDLDEVDSFGSTPLIAATTFGRVAAARALIGAGASLTLSNPEGSTPLHLAAFFGHPEIASSLLEHNANRNLRNDAGATAFDLVAPPFDIDRPLYEQLATNLAPLGLAFDYEAIEASRPAMRRLLRAPAEELARVVYAPEPGAGLPVSTPTALGPPPERLAELYLDAAEHETLRSLLVLRGGELVAERYFNGGGGTTRPCCSR